MTPHPEESGRYRRLAQTERRIAELQECISHQVATIEYLGMIGRDTRMAAALLRKMQHTLAAMLRHRELILRATAAADY